jgi:hypothetical protein
VSEPSRGLTILIDSTEVSDAEVAAISVAVAALTAGSAGGVDAGGADAGGADAGGAGTRGRRGPGAPIAAWRAAALQEGTGGQRVGSLTALRNARADRG